MTLDDVNFLKMMNRIIYQNEYKSLLDDDLDIV